MKCLNKAFAATGLVLLSATAVVSAQPLTIDLPPETIQFRPSKMPGYALATQKCLICHSADYVEYQPPGMQEKQWLAEVNKMRQAYGAPLSDEEIKLIAAYLAATYAGEAAAKRGS